jgi:hypothetical protein
MLMFTPRGPFCVIRVTHIDTNAAGLALSQSSAEAKQFHVESIGPAVKELQPGDRVLMVGKRNEQFWDIPGHNGLMLVKEEAVSLVITETPDETAAA